MDQKRKLLRAITEAMVAHADANPEHLHVTVQEYERDNWARGGVLASELPTTAEQAGPKAAASSAASGDVSTGALHHLLLECQSIDASVDFYTGVVGVAIRARDTHRDSRPLVLTHNGIAFTSASGVGRNVEHLAFPVRSVAAAMQRAQSAGAQIVRGPGAGPYGRTVYLADPDGNEVELFE